jgi:acyl-CoA thioesterase
VHVQVKDQVKVNANVELKARQQRSRPAITGSMTTLSAVLAAAEARAGGLVFTTSSEWMQGRSVFGGLQAAVAFHAMRALVPQAPLRSLQATFIAPVAGELRVQTRILRTGKNATHVEARIVEADATQAVFVGIFGAARSSVVAHMPAPRATKTRAPLHEKPFGVAPAAEFMQHFAVRWWEGAPPFTSQPSTTQVLEIAIDDTGPASEAHVIAIADFIPPIGFSWLPAPAPGSTLTWMLELLADRFDHLPLSGFRIEAELIAARDGYTNQAVTMFAASGEPIALGHQTMLIFG